MIPNKVRDSQVPPGVAVTCDDVDAVSSVIGCREEENEVGGVAAAEG